MQGKVLITGGHGFLGTSVRKALDEAGISQVVAPRSSEYDLTDPAAVRALLTDVKPSLVIHLAARVGGIGANMAHPGKFFYDNAVMGIHLMEEARKAGVTKFITAGTVCAYPKHASVPFKEDEIWEGYPEETNAPYGVAKKALLVQGQAYRQEYGFNAVHLIPVNLYGPGDNFDTETSHVIPALIRRFEEARERGDKSVTAWGTGNASREFLFVDDGARAFVLAAQRYDGEEPINIGSETEITIRELTEKIAELTGFDGDIEWDSTKPDGQPRRKLDISRARELLGFEPEVGLDEGLKRTIEWYRETSRT